MLEAGYIFIFILSFGRLSAFVDLSGRPYQARLAISSFGCFWGTTSFSIIFAGIMIMVASICILCVVVVCTM